MPLAFHTTTSSIRHKGSATAPDISIPAKDITIGVVPAGSTWRRNPIPACNCDSGVNCRVDDTASKNSRQLATIYDAPMQGYCRGICGARDGVNGRSRKDLDKAACQAACDALGDTCIGYTHRSRDGFC